MIKHVVKIDSQLQDLIPRFMTNRMSELEEMEKMQNVQDFDSLGKLGHRLKGVGYNYGFQKLGELAEVLEKSAQRQLKEEVAQSISEISHYIRNVEIEYFDS